MVNYILTLFFFLFPINHTYCKDENGDEKIDRAGYSAIVSLKHVSLRKSLYVGTDAKRKKCIVIFREYEE